VANLSYVCGVPAHMILTALRGMELTDDGCFTAVATERQARAVGRAYDALVRELDAHQDLTDREFSSLVWGELIRRAVIASGVHPRDLPAAAPPSDASD